MADKGESLTARLMKNLNVDISITGESYTGDCDATMTASTTTIVSDDLKDFQDDYFNIDWVMKVLYNSNSIGAAPQDEIRDITDYISVTGTFTTVAFTQNVEADDVVMITRKEHFVISDYTLPVNPAAGSIASFISSGNGSAALGTELGIDASILDAIGHTGVTALTTGVYGNIGNFIGQTNLKTLLAALGIPDVSAKPLYTCLVTDRLDSGTYGLSALNIDLDAIIANQAGVETIASYDLPNDTAENILLTITNTKRLRLDAVWLDLVNLVQDVTIKVYHKIDETNYRQYDVFSWGTAEEDGVLLSPVTINGDWKITVTSTVAQGVIKAIPYNVIKTTMEA